MECNRSVRPHYPKQTKTGSNAAFEQITAQLNALSSAALRSDGGGDGVNANFYEHRFGHDQNDTTNANLKPTYR